MHDLTRQNHRRPQTLIYKLDCASDSLATKAITLDEDVLRQMSARGAATTPRQKPPTKDEMRNTYRPSIEPAWLKHDRQVLRFFAYFQEPVVEHPTENFRIRNIVITYFLEDGSIRITEPKVENSGIWPQGPFVNRHKIPKTEGGSQFFGPADFKIGTDVTLYSRTFRVVDADEFTKFFYKEANIDIGVPESAPIDTFTETAAFKKHGATNKVGFPSDVMEGKEYTELKLGGSRKNHRLEQFLQNDRKVLRFYAYWDDPTRYGTRQYFIMHYFLSDDTVEINNNYARNSGRDPYPVFFTRGPLELNPSITTTPGMIKEPSPLLSPKDIEIGKTIPVYGREFFVYDCDEATKVFYETFMNKVVQPVIVPEEEKVHLQLRYPPHNGFGGEEDSLGSCIHLRPKPPRKDLVKLMTNSDRILRFEAVPENNVPEDAHRKFIIGVFLSDDTVAVWEVRQRNSGCCEGKFKERGVTINPGTGKQFRPADFAVGVRCYISAMPFKILRADEYTLRYMEDNAGEFHQSSMGHISHKLAGLEAPASGAQALSPEDFREHVRSGLGVDLSDQEIITILRGCCVPDTANISFANLFEQQKGFGF